jgi:type II secretion system (T2SS) protein M
MSARDRLVLMGIGLLAVLGAAWILAVSPARKQAAKVSGEVASTRSQLASVLAELAEARSAQARYHSAYASLASLGQAVPTSPEVPSLVYALDKASNSHKVQFSSIATSASSSGSSTSSPAASPSASSAGTASASFTQMPFTFAFDGSYQDLIHLLTQIERFTVQSPGGPVEVSGRLLTIQSITLGAPTQASSASATAAPSNQMTWTIVASAYVLAPASMSAGSSTAGATGTQPSAAGASSGVGGSTATPAVVRVGG